MSVIALSHITKDYGGGHGVFDVSFAVEQGEVFGFLGPNGAGKTTTIRQLMGFLAPDSGTCTINGLDCRTVAEHAKCNFAVSRQSVKILYKPAYTLVLFAFLTNCIFARKM